MNAQSETREQSTHRYGRVGVRPENVTKQAGVRDVARPGNIGYLFHLAQLRAEPPVHAYDFVVDYGRARKAVEGVAECLPELDAEPPAALVVEAVDPVNPRALVVAPQDEEVLGVLNLVGEEEANHLEGLLATVDVIPQEKVVRLRFLG